LITVSRGDIAFAFSRANRTHFHGIRRLRPGRLAPGQHPRRRPSRLARPPRTGTSRATRRRAEKEREGARDN
jgi:hypothetical protein